MSHFATFLSSFCDTCLTHNSTFFSSRQNSVSKIKNIVANLLNVDKDKELLSEMVQMRVMGMVQVALLGTRRHRDETL
jgi:hypothetical protein